MRLFRNDSGVFVDRAPSSEPLRIGYVVCIGRNYAEHAREQGLEPPDHVVVFTKSPASLALHDETIVIPHACQDRPQVDFEGELGVVLGTPAKDVHRSRAIEHVLGYTVANDVSARWWQKHGAGGQFCRGKSFDTFCPIGPEVTAREHVGDGSGLRLTTTVNGEVMQDASTSAMTFDVPMLIAELSRGATLPAGTLLLTGTPSGVGMSREPQRFLRDGDVVEISIESLGTLRSTVREESSR